MTEPFCPHCGCDLMKDQPIILNDFAMMGPMSPLTYKGDTIKLATAERNLVWTLMKACPRPVRFDVILARIDSESEGNVIDVYMSRIRTKLRAIGAPIPFESLKERAGYRALYWKMKP